MSLSFSFQIRDGLESDIEACLLLDHTGETDYVWQMTILDDGGNRHITLRTERLPRSVAVVYTPSETRMRALLPASQCFLVATRRDEPEIIGYALMQHDPLRAAGVLHDIVVARSYRRSGIGARLVNIARHWAREHQLSRLTALTQTKNYPAILFLQQLGFQFSGFDDRYYPNQDIAVFFSQSLRS